MRILHVVGARPNFMKVAPLMRAVAARGGAAQRLVQSGQHADPAMSEVFLAALDLPRPDYHLGIGGASHAEQLSKGLAAFEAVCRRERPDRVVVVGDVTTTLACALAAARLSIPCAHVEAGLRAFDPSMPEESNRIATDQLCDLLFTPSADADANLLAEGRPPGAIHRVGNVMIDTLRAHLARARAGQAPERLGLPRGGYALVTLHRPSNVDDPAALAGHLSLLEALQREAPVAFPVHPRTRQRLDALGLWARLEALPGLRLLPPLGYHDFLGLQEAARVVLTDSGGVQEETTALGVPCLTLRRSTERPVTVEVGTNLVVGVEPGPALAAAREALAGRGKRGQVPALWDGRAAERIADVLLAG